MTAVSENLFSQALDIIKLGATAFAADSVAFVLGFLVRRTVDRNVNRVFLGLKRNSFSSIILPATARMFPGTTSTFRNVGVPVLTLGVIKAYAKVSETLSSAGVSNDKLSTYTSDTVPPERTSDNLFILGFSKTNKFAERIYESHDVPLKFHEHGVIDSRTGNVLYTATVKGGNVQTDYGLLTVIANPFGLGSRAFLFGGCQSLGVSAAALALDVRNIPSTNFGDSRIRFVSVIFCALGLNIVNVYLAAAMRKTSNFQVVITGTVMNDEFVACKFIERRRFKRAKPSGAGYTLVR